MSRITLYTASFVMLVWLSAWQDSARHLSDNERSHKIELSHPGKNELESFQLTEVLGTDSLPIYYYMTVQSVYCYEEVCKVDPIYMYWNNIGEYLRYELPKSVTLEKNEGEAFSNDDYIKLQAILSNKQSAFKNLQIDEITTSYVHGANEDVDAISGATIVDLDESETIEGSSLTCYTLWHWANGEIGQQIQQIASKSYSNEQLVNLLGSENLQAKHFAIHQLIKRKAYADNILSAVVQYISKSDGELLSLLIKYIENAPVNQYFAQVESIINQCESKQRIALLSSLLHYKPVSIQKTHLDLSSHIEEYNSYQEVDLLLSIFDEKNVVNEHILQDVFLLLDKDIFIARRAYYFLSDQSLSKSQMKQLNKFYKKNKDYL